VKPYHWHRVHQSFRCYWDYDGGGLADMGQHYLDPVQYWLGKDNDSPVEVEAVAPPAHPDAVGMWQSVKMKYADGTTLILESGEWGDAPKEAPMIEGTKGQVWSAKRDDDKPRFVPDDLMSGLDKFPNPPAMLNFEDAVRARKRAGGNEMTSHRSACLLHLANAAIRTGRKLQFDPKTFRFVNDAEANKLTDEPMRSPWHL
jgi:predicted dehydrogenase